MTTKAYAEFDPMMMGVRIAMQRDHGTRREALTWPTPIDTTPVEERGVEPDPSVWLRLPDDDARALYEALADYFGHAGHDIRALRKDYDAERARVDKLINHAIGAPR